MVEWSITTVLKTVALRGAGGSNPSLSALNCRNSLSYGNFILEPLPLHTFTRSIERCCVSFSLLLTKNRTHLQAIERY